MDPDHILGTNIAALQGKYLAVEQNKLEKRPFVHDLI